MKKGCIVVASRTISLVATWLQLHQILLHTIITRVFSYIIGVAPVLIGDICLLVYSFEVFFHCNTNKTKKDSNLQSRYMNALESMRP